MSMNESFEIVERLAKWAKKYSEREILSLSSKEACDNELYAIEKDAIALASQRVDHIYISDEDDEMLKVGYSYLRNIYEQVEEHGFVTITKESFYYPVIHKLFNQTQIK